MPTVRTVQERYDVFKEQLSTTVSGDAWVGGPTFQMTDTGGAFSGGIDGARVAQCVVSVAC
jgi:hypothetical protein